ncbi:CLUMA_CG016007, isoform A [Clunio marinus]|uniref:CLUMA_CG016007, isoform A n=1 Tax=Clunio marinus TaxID=568069 RepID=A0A1J1IR00_9DIPT|nr:CLUMA_CG016007, isoform A [Clunio marinus]
MPRSIIKNRNETIKNFTEEQEETKTGDKSEKSTGRAIQSNFYFPLKNLLMNPVQSNRYNNEKAGRIFITNNYLHFIHQTQESRISTALHRLRYNTAHRRYQYTPDSIYPFKGKEHTIGNQYNKAPTVIQLTINSAKFSAPIVVADLSPAPTKFNAPIVVPDMPSAATKFTAPIFVPDVPSSPSKPPVYLTPNMLSASPPKSSYISNMNLGGTVFLPTPLPDETTSKNPSFDLLAFPSHINSSYIPDELDAIKDSIDNNNHQLKFGNDKDNTISSSDTSESPSNEDSNYIEISPEDIMKIKEINDIKSRYKNLPQNIEIVYQPPRLPTEAKLPIMSVSQHMQNVNDTMKSLIMTNNNQPMMTSISLNSSNNEDDDDDEKPYVAPKNLFSFPPNINSVYLPPGMKPTKSPINSYLPPPSGDVPSDDNVQNSEEDSSNQISYIPPKDFYNFPPNIKSTYLPPDYKYPKNPGNSYSPPASGSELNPVLSYMNMMNILPSKNLSPPKDQITFLPPKMNQQMTSGYNYFPPISGSVNGQMMPSPMTPAPMQMPQQMQMIDQMPMTSPDMDQPMNYGMGGFTKSLPAKSA